MNEDAKKLDRLCIDTIRTLFQKKFGFTPEHLVAAAKQVMGQGVRA